MTYSYGAVACMILIPTFCFCAVVFAACHIEKICFYLAMLFAGQNKLRKNIKAWIRQSIRVAFRSIPLCGYHVYESSWSERESWVTSIQTDLSQRVGDAIGTDRWNKLPLKLRIQIRSYVERVAERYAKRFMPV